ncbi:MAG: hypothetical protein ABSH51_23745 [Solirubrobacteraceae bacterium]
MDRDDWIRHRRHLLLTGEGGVALVGHVVWMSSSRSRWAPAAG